jgi:uncharacterized protein YndB with AHSA1/START domain
MTAETLTITTPGEREVTMTRRFDAPRELVFEALTTPEILRRWYGPDGWELVVCEMDVRVGGAWRFVGRTADGREVGQHGTFLEVDPPERLVQTERWTDWDPGETLVTTTLEPSGITTVLTTTMRFPSQEVRDIVMRSGLEQGATQGYEKLASLLAAGRAHHIEEEVGR